MAFNKIVVPEGGQKITAADGKLNVPDNPYLCFIEGDGIGKDIMTASKRIWDAAVEKAYGGKRKIAWMEIYAGEKAASIYDGNYMPEETFEALRQYLIGIKGPLTTPVGGGFRSLNVTLRQVLDLYACVRPVRWYRGVPSPVKRAGKRGHGDLPREHRGRLRRYRVRSGHAGEREAGEVPARRTGREFLRGRGHRHQADQRFRLQATGSRGDPLRAGARASERDPRPQGQHSEVHRGRVPQVGL